MARRPRLLLVGLLAIVAVGWPASGVASVRGAQLARDDASIAGADGGAPAAAEAAAADIVPGTVGRSSPLLDATYDALLKLSWGTRRIYVDSTATIRNTSGGPIDQCP